jgi:hypothetical protein
MHAYTTARPAATPAAPQFSWEDEGEESEAGVGVGLCSHLPTAISSRAGKHPAPQARAWPSNPSSRAQSLGLNQSTPRTVLSPVSHQQRLGSRHHRLAERPSAAPAARESRAIPLHLSSRAHNGGANEDAFPASNARGHASPSHSYTTVPIDADQQQQQTQQRLPAPDLSVRRHCRTPSPTALFSRSSSMHSTRQPAGSAGVKSVTRPERAPALDLSSVAHTPMSSLASNTANDHMSATSALDRMEGVTEDAGSATPAHRSATPSPSPLETRLGSSERPDQQPRPRHSGELNASGKSTSRTPSPPTITPPPDTHACWSCGSWLHADAHEESEEGVSDERSDQAAHAPHNYLSMPHHLSRTEPRRHGHQDRPFAQRLPHTASMLVHPLSSEMNRHVRTNALYPSPYVPYPTATTASQPRRRHRDSSVLAHCHHHHQEGDMTLSSSRPVSSATQESLSHDAHDDREARTPPGYSVLADRPPLSHSIAPRQTAHLPSLPVTGLVVALLSLPLVLGLALIALLLLPIAATLSTLAFPFAAIFVARHLGRAAAG